MELIRITSGICDVMLSLRSVLESVSMLRVDRFRSHHVAWSYFSGRLMNVQYCAVAAR